MDTPKLRDFVILEDVDTFDIEGKTYVVAGLLVTYEVLYNKYYDVHDLLDYVPFVVPEGVEVDFSQVRKMDINDALHMFSNDPRNVFYNLPPDVRNEIDRKMMKIAENTVTDIDNYYFKYIP